jgi:aminomethyltransferase
MTILNYLVDHDFENLTEEQLGEMLTFANAAAALVTTKKGAIKAMPVKEEVLAVRNSCGVFDVSHMGEFFVEGPDAIKFVDFLITNDFKNAEMLKAVYSPLCREDGTVIDDLIAYKLAENKILICVNAANIQKDWNWISSKVSNFNCKLTNRSDEFSLLAVQGPKTESVFKELNLIDNNVEFPYYSILESKYGQENVIIARTGYTGEDGFEVFGNHSTIKKLWKELLAKVP